ncbi:MAG: sensor histidine kinase, partial [Desulfonatronovibrio sp.]
INMSYGLARRFLHQIINRKLQADERDRLSKIVDKILDLCILIETDAFISSTTQCDHEVIRGIAHQVRNPLTVIGGNIMLLQKKVDDGDPRKGIYETMLQEAMRMERMVKNVVVYNDVFQKKPAPELCNIEKFVMNAIDDSETEKGDIKVDIHLDENNNQVLADKEDLKVIIFHVLQNAFEASREVDNPRVIISSRVSGPKSEFLEVKVVNNGPAPDEETLSQIFTPFFSTKAMGTGFGLPIVKLAARKNQGNFRFEIVEDEGIVSFITLPIPGKI